jgi:hypothetical protein
MMDFRKAGKTIIVCSHSMYMVNQLCAKTLWLDSGRARKYGETAKVISDYLAHWEEKKEKQKDDQAVSGEGDKASPPEIYIENLQLVDTEGAPVTRLEQFQTLIIRVRTRCTAGPRRGQLGVGLQDAEGKVVFATTTQVDKLDHDLFRGEQVTELVLPSVPLLKGNYSAIAVISEGDSFKAAHVATTEPFLVESRHPELGTFWMKHHWRFPAV